MYLLELEDVQLKLFRNKSLAKSFTNRKKVYMQVFTGSDFFLVEENGISLEKSIPIRNNNFVDWKNVNCVGFNTPKWLKILKGLVKINILSIEDKYLYGVANIEMDDEGVITKHKSMVDYSGNINIKGYIFKVKD